MTSRALDILRERFAADLERLLDDSVAAVLLALVLNMAILPCAMAVEAAEEAHDCCPPEIRLDASECCVIDDATLDAHILFTSQAKIANPPV